MELIPSIIETGSMFNIWPIFILLFFVFIGFIGLNLIRKSFYTNRHYEDLDEENNIFGINLFKDEHVNFDKEYKPKAYSKEDMSKEAINNMIRHLEEKIYDCSDDRQLEVLTSKLDEYKRLLEDKNNNNLMGE